MTENILKRDNKPDLSYTYETGFHKTAILYLHGFGSSRQSLKAMQIHQFARENGYPFIALDYTGHGESDGTMQHFRIGRCLADVVDVLTAVSHEGPMVVAGSSLGGWLSLLIAEKYPEQVRAIMPLAVGADFVADIWRDRLTEAQRQSLSDGDIIEAREETAGMELCLDFFTEAEQYSVLNRMISFSGEAVLIHGDRDELIPWQRAIEVKNRLTTDRVKVLLLKDTGHDLEGLYSMEVILTELENLMFRVER